MSICYALHLTFTLVLLHISDSSIAHHECQDEFKWPCFTKEFGCLETKRFCDHQLDCEDGSDEELCPHNDCIGRWVQRCKDSHRCIWVGFHCSGYDRCNDGTLDVNCTSCRMNGFLCPHSKRCARPEKKCTGYDVCYDGSTDENCTSCAESGYHCLNKRCIRPERLCNGRDECGDGGSSNWNCTYCFGGAKKCPGNPQRCVRPQDYCTGLDVCGDGSTDTGCEECNQGGKLYADTKQCVRPDFYCSGLNESGDGTSDSNCKFCHNGAFHCSNKRCVRSELRCNGQDTCGDGSSNSNCSVCIEKAVLCREDGKCISLGKICDGKWDCTKGTDEMHCTGASMQSSHHEVHVVYGLFLILLAVAIVGLIWYYKFRPYSNMPQWFFKRHASLVQS